MFCTFIIEQVKLVIDISLLSCGGNDFRINHFGNNTNPGKH